jgi:hypothetical protein
MCKLLETLTLQRPHVCLHQKIYKMAEYSIQQTRLPESGRINTNTHIPAAVQFRKTVTSLSNSTSVFYRNLGRSGGLEK